MAEVKVRVLDNGPYLVEGPLTVVDGVGNGFAVDSSKPAVALCRCGQSKNRPFCDGAHKQAGFQSAERAAQK